MKFCNESNFGRFVQSWPSNYLLSQSQPLLYNFIQFFYFSNQPTFTDCKTTCYIFFASNYLKHSISPTLPCFYLSLLPHILLHAPPPLQNLEPSQISLLASLSSPTPKASCSLLFPFRLSVLLLYFHSIGEDRVAALFSFNQSRPCCCFVSVKIIACR